ncbi:hypothetical protein ScPMuIL_007818 [Solemya velum]
MSLLDQTGLTRETAQELKEAFNNFDKNGDGKISVKELGPLLRILGQNPTESQVKAVMDEADKNKTGFLEEDEYLQLIQKYILDPETVEVELRQAFLFFDKDRNGRLDLKELSRVLMRIGDPLSKEDTDEFLALAKDNGVAVEGSC